jgi:hypothetical protein
MGIAIATLAEQFQNQEFQAVIGQHLFGVDPFLALAERDLARAEGHELRQELVEVHDEGVKLLVVHGVS